MQNFAARLVLGLKKFDHISEGRRSLKWLNVSEKILFNDLVLVFKCLNGLAPGYLADYFITRLANHSRNLRRSGDFHAAGCQRGNEDFTFAELNGGMTCLRTFRALKTLRYLRKDWVIIYLMSLLIIYLIYCFNSIFNEYIDWILDLIPIISCN